MFRTGKNPSGRSYYDFSPAVGWRVVLVDTYEISQMHAAGSPAYQEARRVLEANNPNDTLHGSDWFKGLKGTQRRFVPYNGQPSDEQLRWLRRVLAGSAAAGERVIVAAHQPVYPNATNLSNLPFNFQEILAVLHAFPGVVVTWLAGHDHDGGYCVDELGIHHIVPAAPLEVEVGQDAFGHVEVLPGHSGLRIVWTGKLPAKGTWPDVLECPPRLPLASSL